MKTILCFGDSNTWGFDPESMTAPYPSRHPPDVRWTGVLGRELGADYRIVEEGLNGRTTVHEDPIMGNRNGSLHLPPCLESHKPIDLAILMLGTNDLKSMFNLPPADIANGAGVLARMILQSDSGARARPPQLLLVCPPPTGDMSRVPDLAERFTGAFERSRRLPQYYEALAASLGCGYLDSQKTVQASAVDGLHLDATAHGRLGRAIADAVRLMI